MIWRPDLNLTDGVLDNSIPGRVTGALRFHRFGMRALRVQLDLMGDFADLPGRVLRLQKPCPVDRNVSLNQPGSYLEGFRTTQRGRVGMITSGRSLGPWTLKEARLDAAKHETLWNQIGLEGSERERRQSLLARHYRRLIAQKQPYYPGYRTYPFVEWFGEESGHVIMELNPRHVEVVAQSSRVKKQTRRPHSRRAGVARARYALPRIGREHF